MRNESLDSLGSNQQLLCLKASAITTQRPVQMLNLQVTPKVITPGKYSGNCRNKSKT